MLEATETIKKRSKSGLMTSQDRSVTQTTSLSRKTKKAITYAQSVAVTTLCEKSKVSASNGDMIG